MLSFKKTKIIEHTTAHWVQPLRQNAIEEKKIEGFQKLLTASLIEFRAQQDNHHYMIGIRVQYKDGVYCVPEYTFDGFKKAVEAMDLKPEDFFKAEEDSRYVLQYTETYSDLLSGQIRYHSSGLTKEMEYI